MTNFVDTMNKIHTTSQAEQWDDERTQAAMKKAIDNLVLDIIVSEPDPVTRSIDDLDDWM